MSILSLLLVSFYLQAQTAWGQSVALPRVVLRPLGDCDVTMGWTTFDDRTITFNSLCDYTPEVFLALMTHEYGHLLCLCADHSSDPDSVMNPIVMVGNQIMEDDKWRKTQ